MKNFLIKRKLNIACSVAAIVFMWLVWIIAYYAVKNEYIVPSFTDTFKSLGECLIGGEFWLAFVNTLWRALIAFALSFILAAALAVFSVLSKAFRAFLKPVMIFFRTLPTLAVILILLVWTSPRVAPVMVTVLVIFPMIYSQLMAAIDGIDEGVTEMAAVYNIRRKDRIFKMYFPMTAPNVLSQTGADISLALKITVSAEVMANTYKSLGGMMQSASLYVQMPRLAALTLVTVFIGLAVDVAFSQFEKITFKWSRKESGVC